jgi:hypothetical protein
LNEFLYILQTYASDPNISIPQAGFGSYVANHLIKEKTDRNNKEAMISSKFGDVWEPKIKGTI